MSSGQNPPPIKWAEKMNLIFSRLFSLLRVLTITAGNGNNALSVDVRTLQNTAVATARLGNVTTVDSITNQVLSGGVSQFSLAYTQSKIAYQQTMRNHLTFTK